MPLRCIKNRKKIRPTRTHSPKIDRGRRDKNRKEISAEYSTLIRPSTSFFCDCQSSPADSKRQTKTPPLCIGESSEEELAEYSTSIRPSTSFFCDCQSPPADSKRQTKTPPMCILESSEEESAKYSTSIRPSTSFFHDYQLPSNDSRQQMETILSSSDKTSTHTRDSSTPRDPTDPKQRQKDPLSNNPSNVKTKVYKNYQCPSVEENDSSFGYGWYSYLPPGWAGSGENISSGFSFFNTPPETPQARPSLSFFADSPSQLSMSYNLCKKPLSFVKNIYECSPWTKLTSNFPSLELGTLNFPSLKRDLSTQISPETPPSYSMNPYSHHFDSLPLKQEEAQHSSPIKPYHRSSDSLPLKQETTHVFEN